MNYLQTILTWFRQLESKRKLSLVAAIAFIFITAVLISWWSLTPTYTLLFSQLDEKDANKVLAQLEQDNIPYQLRNNGNDILIDKNLVAKTRLKIMGSDLQLTGNIGFELFDKSDFGMTDFSQKINFQRALQGELERTISSIEEVKQARVHLVIPENHLFEKEDNQPKAAITLHLRGKISSQQVRSIQQLVAASVAHLDLKNVVLVDQNGNMLSQTDEENSSTHFGAKKNIEHYLNSKVTQLLHKIFNSNEFVVKINADINYDELQSELIKPQSMRQLTHEKQVSHSTLDKKGKNKGNQDLTFEKSYEFGHEKELFKRASGTIERLSVSVVLPQNTDAKTLAQLARLIKSTIGFNEQRGDMISVEALIEKSSPQHTVSSLPSTTHSEYVSNKRSALWSDENTRYIAAFLVFVSLMSSSAVVVIKRVRSKKRQQILLELTKWLNHHE